MNSYNSAAVWCGRLDLHLLDQRQRTVGILEFSLRLDICTVWYRNRTLAVIHREALRTWLLTPMHPLVVDDLVWAVEGSRVALSVDGQPSHLVPEVFIGQLVSVI